MFVSRDYKVVFVCSQLHIKLLSNQQPASEVSCSKCINSSSKLLSHAWGVARAYSSTILHAPISQYHTQSPALFQTTFIFCTFLPKLSNIFPPFARFKRFFALILPFFWKIACMPLLSRMGPGSYHQQSYKSLCLSK